MTNIPRRKLVLAPDITFVYGGDVCDRYKISYNNVVYV